MPAPLTFTVKNNILTVLEVLGLKTDA